MSLTITLPGALPNNVEATLRHFLEEAAEILGQSLQASVLFGSAAEGRLRASSDVNLILVLRDFSTAQGIALQGPLTLAQAAIQLKAMFLLESEIDPAMECFAQKFADIVRRHHVLFGEDPFKKRSISRGALVHQTRQSLLNLVMRLRERFTLSARSPDQTVQLIADAIGPLRTCAVTILELEGRTGLSPKAAFEALVDIFGQPAWKTLPKYFSAIREGNAPAEPTPPAVTEHVIELATAMRKRVELL
jgi:predicted nucleotidyltransferase